tara:strand:- start:199 stop:1212 length:1014 start_codon:yes stop_codon:yes gene_type:complete
VQIKKEIKEIQSIDINHLLLDHTASLMSEFYEMQSSFLSGIYKRYRSIETANIILCLAKKMHLEIMRQREKNLNHDISLNNFWNNFNNINRPTQKIVSIANMTGIPKETARRKIKGLINQNFVLMNDSNKEYYWNLLAKQQDDYYKIVKSEIQILAKFAATCAAGLNLNIEKDTIVNEIKSQFSFYWYHFLNYQLKWLKMWQDRVKDIDLILITLQAVIPTLQYAEKNQNIKDLGLDNLYKVIGKTNNQYKFSDTAVSAASISEVTGIPRATCIRKLELLVKLGMLIRETKTKRYFVNQLTSKRTNSILTKENVLFTIENFSEYLIIILNSIQHNQR